MSETAIRIGIIGAGDNTRQRHIPGLSAIDGVEIVGVCNRSRESSQNVAGQFGIDRIYDQWHEAIEDGETDAIVIGTWPYLHCPAAVAALEAGKHVLCEARMAMNASEARAMLAAARARPNLTAQIVPSPFTLRVDGTIRKLLADGFLGDLLAVEVRGLNGFVDRDAPMTWRQDIELSGLNVLSMGIWYEAVMRWIGPARRVSAMGRTFVKTRQDAAGRPHEIRVPDHVDVLAEMECGAQARFCFSAVAGPAEQTAVLHGSEAALTFDGSRGKLLAARPGQDERMEVAIAPELEGHWRVEEEFIGAIRGREPVKLTTFEDGVRYMEFTEAVARGIASGAAVDLPLPDGS